MTDQVSFKRYGLTSSFDNISSVSLFSFISNSNIFLSHISSLDRLLTGFYFNSKLSSFEYESCKNILTVLDICIRDLRDQSSEFVKSNSKGVFVDVKG